MRRQECQNGHHRPWASDCGHDHNHPCPWCRIAELEALVDSQRKLLTAHGKQPPGPCPGTSPHGVECELPAGHEGNHRRHSAGVERTWGR